MQLSVIGCGYLGAVHAAAMASLGHDVLGIDTDPERVAALSQGEAPFYEPGLPELLTSQVEGGRLRFTTSPSPEEIASVEVHFIAVGTPQSAEGGQADLSQVRSAVELLRSALPEGHRALVVGKSTVPVGTAREISERLAGRAHTVWNPEFLREGFAVQDTLHPDRIVYGLAEEPQEALEAQQVLDTVYAPLLAEGIPQILTDYATAELVKTAANSFLATKISFINAMAGLCEAAGADVTVLAQAIGYDARIGHRFLRAGVGFGGGCLPKDIRALRATARAHDADGLASLLETVDTVNQAQRARVVDLALEHVGGDLSDVPVTILGAAFKPDSDDVRDSPALDVASRLSDLGAVVTVCDPHALPVVARTHPHVRREEDVVTALEGAELVLLLTEWEQFVGLDPALAAAHVARQVVIDARNALDPAAWRGAGWQYTGVGR
ncbi:UDP-glucose/GDP-mannose dehydrogenase family protein [Actinomyces sp. 2119]|uniref:UDP-glucose 6-dehydrogenase n=1 Tax=Actinomyces lilanjuaniae TaxID=2321394 RepID=A0ABM6Z428_9ACTO|nr:MULTISPECIES: UDP-glucose/GDP-mannose dehydrogenase family protein [Actinomyces]AYD90005.1 UDP-glucose/GDP-mannose dehydrogenase family protein [Actinomyces lilanjuaniae]RJF42497.1 UDP-glucose/GDP-mannose dehydrogenase family protein [Actinomyces sp. 2119]